MGLLSFRAWISGGEDISKGREKFGWLLGFDDRWTESREWSGAEQSKAERINVILMNVEYGMQHEIG